MPVASMTFSKTDDMISAQDLSKILSVSDATVKNWIRLKKLTPVRIVNSVAYFNKEYVVSFMDSLNSDKSKLLRSRRNKKYSTGFGFYKDYISSDSQNIELISDLSEYIKSKNINLTEPQINYILADCAVKLFLQKNKSDFETGNIYLKEYLVGSLSFGLYDRLINDFIEDKKNALNFIDSYPEIFKVEYVYEKGEDILGLLYLSLSDIKHRKAFGAYYTPSKIVKKIIRQISSFFGKTILDSCCGTGNFLLQLPDSLDISNVFGNDINPTAIKSARINMALTYRIEDIEILYKNFTNKNFLTEENNKKYDYIIGNPPWGAEFNDNDKDIIKEKYLTAGKKNIESYDVFMEKSLSSLNKNGDLIFVLPESVLSVKAHRCIRQIILENNSVKYIEFSGNIFDKVQCPGIILKVQHTEQPMSYIGAVVVKNDKSFVINKERKITPDLFCFSMTDDEYEIYQKIYNGGDRKYLKDNAVFALGIVTGDNKKYISDKKTERNEVVLKGSDIEKYRIKIPHRYIEYIPDNFQQTAPTEVYRAKEKLFYKFISKKLIFAYDNKQRLSLNSCNILIPKIEGMNIKYVMAVLNSRIAQFIYEKKYNSVKVLRSHLENIPIPVCDNITQNKIIKITDNIAEGTSDCRELYNDIEKLISSLYGIDDREYGIIKNSLFD